MTTLETNFAPQEKTRDYRIEHLPKADVILNLDATFPEHNILMEILKQPNEKTLEKLMEEISDTRDPFGNPRFYVKEKGRAQDHVDYIRGRTKKDPLYPNAAKSVDRKGRYAFSGVLNEIVLSKTVKELFAKDEFQDLAKRYGFQAFHFAEPLAALVDKKADQRYLIYNWMHEREQSKEEQSTLKNLTSELRKMLAKNKISPGDLNHEQFMIIGQGQNRRLVLIDIEAYTEIKP